MNKITINPPRREIKTTEYNALAGVDFSQDASNVDKKRSPFSLNMISDNGKNPVKRPGWETKVTVDGVVHNIWSVKIDGKEYLLCHAGGKIYKLTQAENTYTADILKDEVNDGDGCGFFFREGDKDGFYILTGKEYLLFDGEKITDVKDSAYIPTTIIARSPSGGGESYEDINLLSGKMTEKFTGNQELVYQLNQKDIVGVIKIESLQSDGGTAVLEEGTDYTVDKTLGKVTFTKAHPTPLEGADNIYITYEKVFENYSDKITMATQFCTYGVGGNNRVFLTGNSSYEAYDFWSDIYKPSYFPDLNFAIIGAANTAVKGYLKIGDSVAVVKESTGQDTTIFIRTGTLASDNSAIFTVKPGIVGIGAVSSKAFSVLNDDPLFLSQEGVYSISPSNLSYERVTRNRSFYVDAQLRQEKELKNAVSCVWDGCYLLAVNGNVYILDGRKKTVSGTENDYRYECYFWNNVPANCFCATQDGLLWFGTKDGKICRFKSDTESMLKYSDDGQPIRAVWSTPFDDDKAVQRFKTLQKKGCLIVIAPLSASSCTVYYAVDGKPKKEVRQGEVDITTIFEEIDFRRFTFDGNDAPREIYFNKKQRKYKRLQLIFENNKVNEGFGIFKVVKTYAVNGYSKNRR